MDLKWGAEQSGPESPFRLVRFSGAGYFQGFCLTKVGGISIE